VPPTVTKSSRAPAGRSIANTTRWAACCLCACHPQPVNGTDSYYDQMVDEAIHELQQHIEIVYEAIHQP
jgi:hypothetical protein